VSGQRHVPAAFYPPGKTRYPLYRRLDKPQGRSGQVRKISPSPGFDPRTVQPVASRYTDWATQPTLACNNWENLRKVSASSRIEQGNSRIQAVRITYELPERKLVLLQYLIMLLELYCVECAEKMRWIINSSCIERTQYKLSSEYWPVISLELLSKNQTASLSTTSDAAKFRIT
jgi:hypothetical protein